ncbi:MAG: hypothetical protein AAB531_02920 [Patescibacteria group bacterium]
MIPVAYAASCPAGSTSTDIGCIPNDPIQFASKFYAIGLGLIGGVAVLFIIYGGYIILTSQGDPAQLEKGKSYIYYAIAGVLLAIFGFVFVQVIAVNVLRIPGFG